MVWIAGVVMLIMMLHVVADVVGRYVFASPIDGTLEIVSGYYMVALVFLPLAYVTRKNGHIFVELFTMRLRPSRVSLMDAAAETLAFLYVGFLAWECGVEAWRRTMDGEAWETAEGLVAIWPSRWLLPLGLGLMAICLLTRIAFYIRRYRREVSQ